MIHCPVCNGSVDVAFEPQILYRHKATYDSCHECGFLRARNPEWLADAYSSAITSIVTGLVMRNIHVARKLTKIHLGVLGERGL